MPAGPGAAASGRNCTMEARAFKFQRREFGIHRFFKRLRRALAASERVRAAAS